MGGGLIAAALKGVLGRISARRKRDGTGAGTAGSAKKGASHPQKADLGATVRDVVANRPEVQFLHAFSGGTCDAAKVCIGGRPMVMKLRRTPQQSAAEVAVTSLYRALGAPMPIAYSEVFTTRRGTTLGVVVQDFIEGPSLLHLLQQQSQGDSSAAAAIATASEALCSGFLLDCLFANWDVIGGRGGDNIILCTPEGGGELQPYRIDNAGVMGFRAQGGQKHHDAWRVGGAVTEVHTMRDPLVGNCCSDIFIGVQGDALVAQFAELSSSLHPALVAAGSAPSQAVAPLEPPVSIEDCALLLEPEDRLVLLDRLESMQLAVLSCG
eukprot:TRINITY_DN5737_c3_g1_i1.p1 TRINITY_DN5737_c3_g1~~TRINITY_DN5737_c3_g1_i1.p1  ORF type:complete len:324 (+),score=72.81 TRINITY_DN5737_c3_g1_i1:159-1130(+)